MSLSGLPLTREQLYWVHYAQGACSKQSADLERHRFIADIHPSREVRINNALKNSQDFARDFKCKRGARMNPEIKCRLW